MQALVGKEEECLALQADSTRNPERPSQRAAKIILPQGRLRLSEVVVEPVVGVECVIPQVVERRAVPFLGPRTGYEGELPARITAVFGGVCRTLDAKLLKGIHRDQTLRRAKRRGCRQRAARRRSLNNARLGSHICTDTVY